MQLRKFIIIPAVAILIPIVVFVIISVNPVITVERENMFMPTDHKKLIQLALSDPRVKQAVGNKSYQVEFEYGSIIPNIGAPFTDSMIKFIFNNDSYTLVRENLSQNKVIDVKTGTEWKSE